MMSLGRGGTMIFDLRRMERAMEQLGHPERNFVAVHVAGTNGKGSVCALLASALHRCELRTGLYTSPHLERVTERFLIDGREVSEPRLDRIARRVLSAFRTAGVSPTQFEALTAAAFVYFSEERLDIAVVETGLGGRLDATNVLQNVAVSVITNIGLDHMEWLGPTPRHIAAEKAGIVRRRVPVVTGAEGIALSVIARAARSAGSRIVRVAPADAGRAPATSLAGPHQKSNAAVAFAVIAELRRLGWRLPDHRVKAGFVEARWPGRFERFTTTTGQNRITWLLDGAHNAPAASVLADSLREGGFRNLRVVFGALRDKDYVSIASNISPFASSVVTAPVPSPRRESPQRLARLHVWKDRSRSAASVEAALEAARGDGPGTVLVTGSLYLVGAARAWIRRQPGARVAVKGSMT